MICEICQRKSNIIYTTRKYGFICNICMWDKNNSEEAKIEKELEKHRMYKKYSVGE